MKTRPQSDLRKAEPVPDGRTSPLRTLPKTWFPIVGIGASAGGLEALEQFLRQVPDGSGMAFVIILHLDPTHKGMMPELLGRATSMRVIQVKDRTRVQPNCVYVIPPNKDMSILHGTLHLLAPVAPRGLRLPIDFFLRSLAQDRQEHSIGVILSGMGSDGTLGLRAIKERAGLGLAQDPATAKFDPMPRSVVDAGLADIVAPVDELPGKIMAYLRRIPLLARTTMEIESNAQSAVEKVVVLLRAHTSHDFSLYKRSALYRRIERRMGIHQITKMSVYVRYLQENSQELDILFKELLIGVTNFFRDTAVWDELRNKTLPDLIASRPDGYILRAWVPGCSTGEEAYSLAMVFKEVMEKLKSRKKIKLQVFATDLDKDAIDKARQGIYPENICADVSPRQMSRFFTKTERGCRVTPEIREMVIFAPQSLIMDPPFTKLDFLSCRNLLIYLGPDLQKKLFPLFHYSLTTGGILVLGSAETVGNFSDLFATLNNKLRIFQRIECATRTDPIDFPSAFSPRGRTLPTFAVSAAPASLQSLAEQLILQHHAPPAVLVNGNGDIFFISGRTGRYLEPAAGKANWNIFAMAREGLRFELTSGFHKALRQKETVTLTGLRIDAEHLVSVAFHRLEKPQPLQGLMLIVFSDVPSPSAVRTSTRRTPAVRSVKMETLQHELQRCRIEARNIHEEMQTSQEELRSANEEMQSTNEELQSTNEELTTSKEEMQSLNEELQTVNAELQSKVDELSRASNDMKNLLNSTDIATLFLDKALNVRRFTPQAAKIIRLISADVGRPITDLVSALNYPALGRDVRAVLRTLIPSEKTIATDDARWFRARVMPYRTMDDSIDGVVITFADITVAKTLEAKLRAKQVGLEKRVAQNSADKRHRERNRAV